VLQLLGCLLEFATLARYERVYRIDGSTGEREKANAQYKRIQQHLTKSQDTNICH
jgi:hypothetical protein